MGEDSIFPTLTWLSPAEGAFFNTDTVTASLQLTDDIAGFDPSSLGVTLDGVYFEPRFTTFNEPVTLRVRIWIRSISPAGAKSLDLSRVSSTSTSVDSSKECLVEGNSSTNLSALRLPF